MHRFDARRIDENFDPDADYYICGLKDMVNSVKEHLEVFGKFKNMTSDEVKA